MSTVDIVEFEFLTVHGTDIVAVVVARVDGADIEPIFVISGTGGMRVETGVVLPLGIDLRAHIGGLSFEQLPQAARVRIARMLVERASLAFGESAA